MVVVNSPISRTEPDTLAASTQSPTLKGRRNSSISPAATFDNVPCSARPMARPAAPRTAIIDVVSTPKLPSVTTTVSVRMAYLTSAARMGASVRSMRLDLFSQSRIRVLKRRDAHMPMMMVIRAARKFSPYSVASASVCSVTRSPNPMSADIELIEISFICQPCLRVVPAGPARREKRSRAAEAAVLNASNNASIDPRAFTANLCRGGCGNFR